MLWYHLKAQILESDKPGYKSKASPLSICMTLEFEIDSSNCKNIIHTTTYLNFLNLRFFLGPLALPLHTLLCPLLLYWILYLLPGLNKNIYLPWKTFTLKKTLQFSSVQSLCHVQLFATPWIAARQASLSIANFQSSLKTHVHRVRDAIQPSHPLSSPSPPAPNPSQHQSLFQWVSSSHEVVKVLEFQL